MRVLIAEDDPISQKVLQGTLAKWGYEVIVTNDGREALEVLKQSDSPKLAILDWMMPEMDGPSVCKAVRALPEGEYYYLLLLTAKGRKEDIVEGLEAGADDYLTKPFDRGELRVRVRCGQRILQLQSALLKARDDLQQQATHDSLTGLLNRAAIFEDMEREESRSMRTLRPMAVVMMDLDHFKKVNDTFGHAAGDAVLQEAARRMQEQARAYDVVGRYGGEEFLIFLQDSGLDAAMTQAERIRCSIAAAPVEYEDKQIHITASLGIASTDRLNEVGVQAVIKAADDALYRAKAGGRNRVECANQQDATLTERKNF